MKLTNSQKKKIIALYADGVSQTKLAKQFHVARSTIKDVLDFDTDFLQKAADANKSASEEAALSFMERMQKESEELIGEILASVKKDFANASVRDRMGAVKIMTECFLARKSTETGGGAVNITVSIEDTAAETEGAANE